MYSLKDLSCLHTAIPTPSSCGVCHCHPCTPLQSVRNSCIKKEEKKEFNGSSFLVTKSGNTLGIVGYSSIRTLW